MMPKKWRMSMLVFVLLLSCLPMFGSKAAAADYTQGLNCRALQRRSGSNPQ